MNRILIVIIILLLVGVGAWAYFSKDTPSVASIDSFEACEKAGYPVMESYPRQCKTPDGRNFVETLDVATMIEVEAPKSGAAVKSPLTVKGKARGPWYFEASFPAELRAADGTRIVAVPVQAQGEWMTTEFVPFEAKIAFTVATRTPATLILHRDNPSGLPEFDAKIEIPVILEK